MVLHNKSKEAVNSSKKNTTKNVKIFIALTDIHVVSDATDVCFTIVCFTESII